MTIHTTSSMTVPASRDRQVLQMAPATLTVGSRIMTALGARPVEDLKPGDLIVTKDYGMQKLRYLVFRDTDLLDHPSKAPIKMNCPHLGFEAHAYFAPDQMLALRHPMFDMMFGAPEVLVRCGDVVDHPGVEQVNGLTSLTYVALGFSRPHLISCNGAMVGVGPANKRPSRLCLGAEEARLAMQLMEPRQPQAKRHSFPLH